MTQQVSAILERSCSDCHSNKTVWPWYSNVAPVSCLICDDVNKGRQALSLSEWVKLDRDRQERKLRKICDKVSAPVMPLSSSLPLHPTAASPPASNHPTC